MIGVIVDTKSGHDQSNMEWHKIRRWASKESRSFEWWTASTVHLNVQYYVS